LRIQYTARSATQYFSCDSLILFHDLAAAVVVHTGLVLVQGWAYKPGGPSTLLQILGTGTARHGQNSDSIRDMRTLAATGKAELGTAGRMLMRQVENSSSGTRADEDHHDHGTYIKLTCTW
jgi:hypothetical protein